MFHKVLAHLCILGAEVCALALAAALLQRKKTVLHYMLAGQIVCSSILCLSAYMILTPSYHDFRYTFYLHMPAGFFIAPFTVAYVYTLIDEEYRLKGKNLLIFAAPLASLVLAPIWFIAAGYPPMSEIISYYTGTPLSAADIVISIAFIVNFVYYVLIIKELVMFLKPKNLGEPISVVILICFAAVALVSAFSIFSITNRNMTLMGMAGAGLCVVVVTIAMAAQRYPALLEGMRDIVAESKPHPTALEGVDLGALEKRLEGALGDDRVYQDGDLTLGDLGKKIGVSRNQLSAFINQRFSKNFKTYVNEWRVKEAKKILTEDSEMPVMRVALEVGFNSKSTFNQTFQKITGQTPTDFRETVT